MPVPMTCIPFANGVPAASGPPVWWDTTSGSAPAFNTRIDDPRWRGATRRAYPTGGGGAGEHVAFRALYHTQASTNSLYLSWFIKVDQALNPGFDRIFVGFQRPGGVATVIRLVPFAAATSTNGLPVALQGSQTYQRSGTTWTSLGDEPDFIAAFARAWVFTGPAKWAVNLRVPIVTSGADIQDAGLNLGTAFNFWYEVQTVNLAGIAPYAWGRTAPTVAGTNFPDPADTNAWGPCQLGGSPTACSSGVSLRMEDVGTTNTPSSEIRYSRTQNVFNTFFARPLNQTGSPIPASTPPTVGISARFRMANWGSQPDWNDVADPSTLWSDIRGGGDVQNTVGIPHGSQGDLTFQWQLNNQEIADFEPRPNPPGPDLPPLRRPHSCILVDLSGPGLDFLNDSVYINADVVQASSFQRDADISVVGLGSLGTPDRDVYVYVETTNMPQVIRRPRDEPPDRPGDPNSPPPGLNLARGIEGGDDEGGGVLGGTSIDDIAAVYPTYRVHVFYDTGDTIAEGGVTRKVLRPQSSFGHVLTHEGPLFGWDHELRGRGLVELAPNFYKLPVPTEGKVSVSTKVTAWDKPRPWWWWLWQFLLRLWRLIRRLLRRLFGS